MLNLASNEPRPFLLAKRFFTPMANFFRLTSFVLAAILLFTLLSTTGCSNGQPEITPSLPREVSVVAAGTEIPVTRLAASGSFAYKTTANLAFETGGVITWLNFSENQPVTKGELLAQLADTDLTIQVGLAKTQLEQTRLKLQLAENGATKEQVDLVEAQYREAIITYEDLTDQQQKLQSLYAAGAIPERQLTDLAVQLNRMEQKVIQAEAQLNQVKSGARPEELALLREGVAQAELQLQFAQHQLAKAGITAPFSGVVLKKLANTQELIGPGQPVLVLADPTSLVFTFGATSAHLAHLNPGQQVWLDLTGSISNSGPGLAGTVSNISLLPDPATRLYQVEVKVENSLAETGLLRAGMIGQVKLALPIHSPALLLPPQAVVGKGSSQVVYVVQTKDAAQTVVERQVTVGQVIDGRLEIIDGLAEGELVVVAGASFLRDGEQIRVKEGDRP